MCRVASRERVANERRHRPVHPRCSLCKLEVIGGEVANDRRKPFLIFQFEEMQTAHADRPYLTFPGPHSARPGLAPVCSPFLITCEPLTRTWRTPDAY